MSYISSIYHIVIVTADRIPCINIQHRKDLYGIIAAEVKKHNSFIHIINSDYDHIHLLINLNQQVALSSMMRDIKSKSSYWMRKSGLFPLFKGWAKEYAAFSISESHREAVINYIANQQEHHKDKSLDDEYRRLVMKAGLVYRTPNA